MKLLVLRVKLTREKEGIDLENAEIRNLLDSMQEQVTSFRGLFDLEQLEEDIAEAENQMTAPDFWDDSEKAQALINRNNTAKETYDQFQAIADEYEELNVMWEMQQEDFDAELQTELEGRLVKLQEKIAGFELSLLLDEPYDKNNAILELHPGAGGTESQDWGSMLLRMYTRWAEQHGFSVETIDYQSGDEAGIKSVTLMIKGTNAYGT